MKKALLTIEEAARALSIRPAQLYELMARGELPVVRIGRAVRIPATAVERRVARMNPFPPHLTSTPDEGGE